MLDFAGSDLHMRSVASQREREARQAARFADRMGPQGVRAALAAHLARLALKLDAEAIKSVLPAEARIARRHG